MLCSENSEAGFGVVWQSEKDESETYHRHQINTINTIGYLLSNRLGGWCFGLEEGHRFTTDCSNAISPSCQRVFKITIFETPSRVVVVKQGELAVEYRELSKCRNLWQYDTSQQVVND